MPTAPLPAVDGRRPISRRLCVAWLSSATALLPSCPLLAQAMPAAAHAYRAVGAGHLYATYRDRIFRGRLPPLLYAIAVTETEVDGYGRVVSASLVREPAAAQEVGPWVLELIRAASPFPRPTVVGRTRWIETWLVDRSYRFQLDTLTEGQD